MSPVSQTSRNAYMNAVKDGRKRTQRERVEIALRTVGSLTRWEISRVTGIRYASVCSAVFALIDAGVARDDLTTRRNPDGGDVAKVVELVAPRPTQRSFNL